MYAKLLSSFSLSAPWRENVLTTILPSVGGSNTAITTPLRGDFALSVSFGMCFLAHSLVPTVFS